jgi:hypothetical protein
MREYCIFAHGITSSPTAMEIQCKGEASLARASLSHGGYDELAANWARPCRMIGRRPLRG